MGAATSDQPPSTPAPLALVPVKANLCILEDTSASGGQPFLAKAYLACYSGIQFLGWGYIALGVIFSLVTRRLHTVWFEYLELIWFLQLLVFLDIFHLLTGIVSSRGNVSTLLIIHCKVTRRMQILLSLAWYSPETQKHWIMAFVLLSWALIDIIRYAFYSLNTFKVCPTWLINLRYQEFIVLYPFGLIAEFIMWFHMIFSALTQCLTHNYVVYGYSAFVVCYLCWRLWKFPTNYRLMWEEMHRRVKN